MAFNSVFWVFFFNVPAVPCMKKFDYYLFFSCFYYIFFYLFLLFLLFLFFFFFLYYFSSSIYFLYLYLHLHHLFVLLDFSICIYTSITARINCNHHIWLVPQNFSWPLNNNYSLDNNMSIPLSALSLSLPLSLCQRVLSTTSLVIFLRRRRREIF